MNDAHSFWDVEDEFGSIHHCNFDHPHARPEVLIVFIHGIFGSARGTWDPLPEAWLRETGIDADVFSYTYPCLPWERASVEGAAEHLRNVLAARFTHCRHMYFCVHSTGGLVVKELVRQEVPEMLQRLREHTGELLQLPYATLRMRRIFNLAVPHAGGTLSLSIFSAILYFFLYPVFRIVGFISFGKLKTGRCELVRQLHYRNSYAQKLEQDYASLISQIEALGIARPISLDFFAADDAAVADPETHVRNDNDRIELRGGHTDIKRVANYPNVLMEFFKKRLSPLKNIEALDIASNTVARIHRLHSALRVALPFTECCTSPQRNEMESLLTFVRSESTFIRVVSGEAGVGKSVTLRELSKFLGVQYLRSNDREDMTHPLPIFVPMQQIDCDCFLGDNAATTRPTLGAVLFDAIAEQWSQFAKGLFTAEGIARRLPPSRMATLPTIDKRWVMDYVRERSVVIILDGVDEFLANNPMADQDLLASLIGHLADLAQGNPAGLRLIIGVRSSVYGLDQFSGQYATICKIDAVEAEKLVPGVADWSQRLHDERLQALLYTPIILYRLNSILPSLDVDSLRSKTQILEAILRARIMEEMPYLKGYLGFGDGVKIIRSALMAVAWRFHAMSRGQIELDAVVDEVGQLCERWLATRLKIDVGEREILEGFRILGDPKICRQVLQRTLFFQTGPSSYRFIHQMWEEHLVACFVSECVRLSFFDVFKEAAIKLPIFFSAGEMLSGFAVTIEVVERIRAARKTLADEYVVANIGPLFSNTLGPMDGPAAKALVREVATLEGVGKHTCLHGLTIRTLRNDKADPASFVLRRELDAVFRGIVANPSRDAINTSLAWCYLRRYSTAFGTPPPDNSWIGIEELGHGDDYVLDTMCNRNDSVIMISAKERSLQMAFVGLMEPDVVTSPHRAISVAHYLYFLCVVYNRSAHISEVEAALKRVFEPGNIHRKTLEAQWDVPECVLMYDHSKHLFDGK